MSTSSQRARRLLALAAVGAALTLVACGSSSSTTTGGDTTLPMSTLPPTVPTTTPPTDATTTTEVPKPTWQLTGLVAEDPSLLARPAVVAKVGNYDAYPHSGLNDADIVFEEIINDRITRFAVVYHSTVPADIVGPIRSGRIQDVDLLTSLNSPILAWAGGNAYVTQDIVDSTLINMSMTYCKSACFRTDFFKAPYNLYFDIEEAWKVAPEGGKTPRAQFTYRSASAVPAGTPAAGVDMTMDAYRVKWSWNAEAGIYERAQNGKVDEERNGEVVTTENVLVLKMTYKSAAGSPNAVSVGEGEAWLFSGGTVVHGTWRRADNTQPYTLLADDGSAMLLTPGRTFVMLPRTSDTVTPF